MKIKMLFVVLAIATCCLWVAPTAQAQCAMCRATVENNISSGENRIGSGLNTGILYLMVTPYLVISVIGYFWYRNSKKKRDIQLRVAQAIRASGS